MTFPITFSITYSIVTTIMFIIFWDFLIVEQTFLSPQVKQSMIINDKLVLIINEFPNELPNDLRLSKLGKIRKISKLHELLPSD